jgi:hypothetical protein
MGQKSYSSKDRAYEEAENVVLGTTRYVYLSKSKENHSCIDEATRDYFLAMGLAPVGFMVAWMLSFACWWYVRKTYNMLNGEGDDYQKTQRQDYPEIDMKLLGERAVSSV